MSGVPVDLSQVGSAITPQSVFSIINTALSPLGINIQWPSQSTLDDGTVEISPLVVGIDNNTLGQQVIGANENSVQPVREALVNALLSANCNLADGILVGDIGLGVLAGGGNLNLDLGGASAMTNDLAATSPFGPGRVAALGVALGRQHAATSAARPERAAPSATGNSGLGGLSCRSPWRRIRPRHRVGSGQPRQPQAAALGPLSKTVACVSLGPRAADATPATLPSRSACLRWHSWWGSSRGTCCGSAAACSLRGTHRAWSGAGWRCGGGAQWRRCAGGVRPIG